MPVADTSLIAYDKIISTQKMSRQQIAIIDWVERIGNKFSGITRSELSEASGIRLSSVCGRVNELVAIGKLEELPRRPCRVTKSSAHPVRPKGFEQMSLFR